MHKKYFIKKIFFYILFICIQFSLYAQNTDGQLLSDSSDSRHKVMIIPFNQYNYLSDADPELASKNKKNPKDISTLFRYGLNYNVRTHIIAADNYSILSDTTIDSQKDLQMIYANLTYAYEKPLDVFAKDSSTNKKIPHEDLFGNSDVKEESTTNEKKSLFSRNETVEETEQKKYMNAVAKNPDVFVLLHKKYGTDLFLFINQFELITNYNHCLDRSANYFERKVVVHYSIYNAHGKQLKGDAVTVTFSSAQTSVDDIIGKNFPVIAEFLNQSIDTSIHPTTKKTK